MLFAIAITALTVWELTRPGPVEPPAISQFAVRVPLDIPGNRASPNTMLALSRDGSTLAYVGQTGGTARLFRRAMDELDATPIAGTDSDWLAYVSDESGRDEVYVRPDPGPGGKLPVSIVGGTEPAWSTNGREIFFRTGDQMLVAPVQAGPPFGIGTPQVLFRDATYLLDGVGNANYDVFADAQRFVMVQETKAYDPTIILVLNWFEELKQRLPAP